MIIINSFLVTLGYWVYIFLKNYFSKTNYTLVKFMLIPNPHTKYGKEISLKKRKRNTQP